MPEKTIDKEEPSSKSTRNCTQPLHIIQAYNYSINLMQPCTKTKKNERFKQKPVKDKERQDPSQSPTGNTQENKINH